ncbi:hypothetical protein Fmac_024273 [Flemingia macrophylla]|uniref:Uncharacterized protein n=1 Tax=Flemingia macrophylla TaxID=520843 RepID=A0ABD1LNW5_9FABA
MRSILLNLSTPQRSVSSIIQTLENLSHLTHHALKLLSDATCRCPTLSSTSWRVGGYAWVDAAECMVAVWSPTDVAVGGVARVHEGPLPACARGRARRAGWVQRMWGVQRCQVVKSEPE